MKKEMYDKLRKCLVTYCMLNVFPEIDTFIMCLHKLQHVLYLFNNPIANVRTLDLSPHNAKKSCIGILVCFPTSYDDCLEIR